MQRKLPQRRYDVRVGRSAQSERIGFIDNAGHAFVAYAACDDSDGFRCVGKAPSRKAAEAMVRQAAERSVA